MATGASDGFDFPRTPGGTLVELWNAVFRLLPQLSRKVLYGVEIRNAETMIAHGERSTPKGCNVTLMSNATWWKTRDPDEKYLYLQASGVVQVDIEVIR